ncbi:hypothetical protein HNR39_003928 [Glaciimonas immobilis]|uniref:Uncharacterized protein n=1 Tax=Glaciimonas immobilis TaxID=728004 RepID=A0A840RW10_9BURK|nr:hypothetical protein [Glaciimonas immobilis]
MIDVLWFSLARYVGRKGQLTRVRCVDGPDGGGGQNDDFYI